MRGDEVPPSTRWQGNPIAPWNLFRKKRGDAPEPPPKNDRSKRRVTRTKKAAKKAAPPVIDPYLPANGNFGYRVSRYELDLEYKVAINRLSGSATITAVTLAALQHLHPRPVRRPVGVEGVGERQAPGPLSVIVGGKLHIALHRRVARGRGDDDRRALRRDPATDPIPLGRSRFRGADQRRAGRRAAQRRRVVVPLRRPSQRQGQLPHPDQHREPVPRGGQRRVAVPAGRGPA